MPLACNSDGWASFELVTLTVFDFRLNELSRPLPGDGLCKFFKNLLFLLFSVYKKVAKDERDIIFAITKRKFGFFKYVSCYSILL